MTELIIASNNKKKITEIKNIIESLNLNIQVVTLADIKNMPKDIKETGTTFFENAKIKAEEILKLNPDAMVLADDSGLEVDFLNGRPGVYSARYASSKDDFSSNHDDEANLQKVLLEMQGVETKDRTANFKTVIVLVKKEKADLVATGTVKGFIAEEKRGDNGFGYDPIFIEAKSQKTFAEMTQGEKNQVSHRGRALQQLAKDLKTWLEE